MGVHDEAKLDVKFMDFAKQMNLYLNHFPRHEKYGLSQVIRNKAYEVYGFIVEGQKRYQKRTSLANADIAHEQLRMFLRLAFELGYFAFKDGAQVDKEPIKTAAHRYLVISRLVDELGRMIGGWIAADKAKEQRLPVAGPQGKRLNMCPICSGNWNNGSNAGVWALNCNNSRGTSNDNYGWRSDSNSPRTARADGGIKGGAFLRAGQPVAKSAALHFPSRHRVVLDRLVVSP